MNCICKWESIITYIEPILTKSFPCNKKVFTAVPICYPDNYLEKVKFDNNAGEGPTDSFDMNKGLL